MSIRAIISDADGTLVNTVELIRRGQYETAKQYLLEHGLNEQDIPEYEAYITVLNATVGGAARDTLEQTLRALYVDNSHHIKAVDFDQLHAMLNPVQNQLAPQYVSAYDGLDNFLTYLGKHSIKLAIFTSGTPHHVVRNFGIALPQLNSEALFRDTTNTDTEKLHAFITSMQNHYNIPALTVVTCDDVVMHKPNPEGILLAMKRLDVQPNETLVLGDHKVDIETALRAGIEQRVGISHGFDNEMTLVKSGASKVVRSLREFCELITSQNTPRVILASQSPRRRELLQKMGVEFDVVPSGYDEVLDDARSPEVVAKELALGKALDVAGKHPEAFAIGADTIVTLDGKQLGKPDSAEHAKEMLRSLAGRSHDVTTGIAIVCKAKGIELTHADTTKVFFADYNEQAIDEYIATGDPFDKAGGYGIQTLYGSLITKIEGDFDTVVGLNTTSLAQMLHDLVG